MLRIVFVRLHSRARYISYMTPCMTLPDRGRTEAAILHILTPTETRGAVVRSGRYASLSNAYLFQLFVKDPTACVK